MPSLKQTNVELTAVYPHKILRQAFRRFVLGWNPGSAGQRNSGVFNFAPYHEFLSK